MIFADSGVWVDFFNGVHAPWTAALKAVLGAEAAVVGDLVVTEVLQGFRDDRSFQIALELFGEFDVINVSDERVAVAAAKNFRFLRTRGVTVRKTIDTLIATRCIVDGHELLHNDRDFDGFEQHLGLRIVRLPRAS